MADPPVGTSNLVTVTLSDGSVARVKPEDVETVQLQGGQVSTPEQIAAAREQWEYGGIGGMAKAGAAALARGATAGLSDVVIGGFSGGAKELEALRRVNPRVSLAGEIGGTVLGGAVGGPVGAIEHAGATAEKLVAAGVGKGVLSTAARGITEGIGFGVGSAFSEAALGDDYSKLGELLSSQIGMGALVGGSAGLGLALASKGFSAVTSGFRSNIETSLSKPSGESIQRVAAGAIGDAAPGVGDAVARNTAAPWYAKALASLSSTINPRNDRTIIEKFLASPEARAHVENYATLMEKAGDDLTNQLRELHKTVERTADHFMGPMKSSEIQAALGDADRAAAANVLRNSLGDYQGLLAELGSRSAELSTDGIKFNKLVDHFEVAAKRVETGIASGTNEGLADAFMAADELKRAAGKRARRLGEMGGPGLHGLEPAQRTTRDKFIEQYEQMRRVLEHDAWGSAGRKQAAVNAPWSALLKEQELAGPHSFGNAFTKSRTVGDFGLKAQVVEADMVHSWLGGLMNRNASERLAGLNSYLERAKQFVKAGREHLALTPAQAAAAARIEEQAARVARSVDEATTVATHKAQFAALTGQVGGGLSKAMVGHMIGGLPGAIVGSLAGNLSDPVLMIKQLAAIDRITGAGARKVSGALEEAAGRATTLPRRTFGVAAKIGTVVTKTGLSVESFSRLRKTEKEYEQRAATIEQVALKPLAARELAAAAFRDISGAAPNTTEAAGAALARTIAYLQRELPKVGLANPFVQKQQPSTTEKRTFNRKARAAENPAELLSRVLSGKATAWEVDAVANTSPALYASMRVDALAMLGELTQRGKVLEYQDRSRLDLALGLGIEPMLDPDMMLEMQMPFAAPAPQQTPPSSAEMRKQAAAAQTRPEAVAHPGA